MASIGDLYSVLQGEAERAVALREAADHSNELSEVLIEVIRDTLVEIKLGADSDDFSDLTVINFIIKAAAEGYTPHEIKAYVATLRPASERDAITVI